MMFSLKTKTIFIALSIVLSVYLLIPTVMGLKNQRETLKASGSPEPWFFKFLPDKELNLGLDLRGGLYVELEVGVEEALKYQVDVMASDIKRRVITDEFKDTNIEQISGYRLRATVKAADQGAFKEALIEAGFGNNSLVLERGFFELYYDVKIEPQQARKDVLLALQKIGDADLTHDDKLITVAYLDDKKNAAVAALQSLVDAGKIAPVAALPDNILYLSLAGDYFDQLKANILEQAANSARNRIDRFGVAEANVSKQGSGRLVVELPGVKDPEQIIDIVKRSGKLEFHIVDNSWSAAQLTELIDKKSAELKLNKVYEGESVKKLNEALHADLPNDTEIAFGLQRDPMTKKVVGYEPYLLQSKVDVTGDMLENASVQTEQNMPVVSFSFNKTGTKAFGELTSANVGNQLAIVLDGIVNSAPNIRTPITGGQGQIELGFGAYDTLFSEAQDIVLVLKEGALPATLSVASKNVIGPSLGKASIETGLKSLLIAALGVIIFMIAYYRVGGIITDFALLLNVLYLFAILCLFQASLSLPGIAGIVLTMGIAVDSNVLIFERMREERILDKPADQIVESGYKHALSAIVDGNMATLISGMVLFQFGTGPIKGFATTLIIGILTSLFTAIVVTRHIYDWKIQVLKVKKLSF